MLLIKTPLIHSDTTWDPGWPDCTGASSQLTRQPPLHQCRWVAPALLSPRPRGRMGIGTLGHAPTKPRLPQPLPAGPLWFSWLKHRGTIWLARTRPHCSMCDLGNTDCWPLNPASRGTGGWFLGVESSQYRHPGTEHQRPCLPDCHSQTPGHLSSAGSPQNVLTSYRNQDTEQFSVHHEVINDLLHRALSSGRHLWRGKSCHQTVIKKEPQALLTSFEEHERGSNSSDRATLFKAPSSTPQSLTSPKAFLTGPGLCPGPQEMLLQSPPPLLSQLLIISVS